MRRPSSVAIVVGLAALSLQVPAVAFAEACGGGASDPPPPPSAVSDVRAAEPRPGQAGSAVFVFSLLEPYICDQTFNFQTHDGTATAGDDYRSTTGTFALPAGSTTHRLSVEILGDSIREGAEEFSLEVRRVTGSGSTVGAGLGEGVIADHRGVDRAATINSAQVALNLGDPTVMDRGDRFVLRFNRGITVPDPSQFYVHVTDATGKAWVLENEAPPYGVSYTVKGNALKVTVNEEETLLVYPLTITDTSGIYARGGSQLEVVIPGSRDAIID